MPPIDARSVRDLIIVLIDELLTRAAGKAVES